MTNAQREKIKHNNNNKNKREIERLTLREHEGFRWNAHENRKSVDWVKICNDW